MLARIEGVALLWLCSAGCYAASAVSAQRAEQDTQQQVKHHGRTQPLAAPTRTSVVCCVLRFLQDGKEVVVESWASRHKQALLVCFALAVFCFLLVYPIFKEPEKQNCLALLVFASLLWCTEAIPLFVTSLLVPFLIVVLRVLDDVEQEPPARLTPKQAAPAVFHTMFSQVGVALMQCHHTQLAGCLSAIAHQ